jgi:hypothetical protein
MVTEEGEKPVSLSTTVAEFEVWARDAVDVASIKMRAPAAPAIALRPARWDVPNPVT